MSPSFSMPIATDATWSYSGLSAVAEQITQWYEWHDDGRLVWDTTALISLWASKVGIHYNATHNTTYVGLDPRPKGSVFIIR